MCRLSSTGVFLTALTMSVVIGACRDDSPDKVVTGFTSVTESKERPGWRTITGENYEVSLPPAYTPFDLTSSQLDQVFAEAVRVNPNMAVIQSQLDQLKSAGIFKLMAIGEMHSSGFADSLNLVVEPVPAHLTVQQYEELSQKMLEALAKSGSLSSSTEEIGANRYRVVTYRMNAPTMSGDTIEAAVMTWVVIHDANAYVMTFGTSAGESNDLLKFTREIMETFKIR